MKVADLAGGLGALISEETTIKPRLMVHIGSQSIGWNIMNMKPRLN